MKKKTENSAKILWQQMRPWAWPVFFRALGVKAILVSDRDLISHLESVVTLRCQTATPQDIDSPEKSEQTLTDIHTVIVFSRSQEQAIVRRLRAQFPGKRIFSAQYDLGPNSHERPKSPPPKMLKPDAVRYKTPIILLATPGSDSEYLAAMMAQVGLPCPVEYFGKPLVGISAAVDKFMPARYLHAVQKSAGDKQPELPMLLHTDVVSGLINNTALSVGRLKKWLRASGAKVIYVRRDDKLFQAGLMALLEKRPFRSLWSALPNQKEQLTGNLARDFLAGMEALQQIEQEEQLTADILEDQPAVLRILTEDIVKTPMDQLAKIADFLGTEIDPPAPVSQTGYQEEYAECPGLLNNVIEFRRQYIDRLGLHVSSKSGSASL